MKYELRKDQYLISTDKTLLKKALIHEFLTKSYWAKGISQNIVEKTIENSLCFGVYKNIEQVGYARIITDYTTFGYIADVFIIESHRKKGLSKWLMRAILDHPELQGFRRWMLATKDAHSLYEQFGFTSLKNPGQFMELHNKALSLY